MENDSFQWPKNKTEVPQSLFNVVRDKNAVATLLPRTKHDLITSVLGVRSREEQAKGRFVWTAPPYITSWQVNELTSRQVDELTS